MSNKLLKLNKTLIELLILAMKLASPSQEMTTHLLYCSGFKSWRQPWLFLLFLNPISNLSVYASCWPYLQNISRIPLLITTITTILLAQATIMSHLGNCSSILMGFSALTLASYSLFFMGRIIHFTQRKEQCFYNKLQSHVWPELLRASLLSPSPLFSVLFT